MVSVAYNANIVSDSIITSIDFASAKSSPKTGTSPVTINDISGNGMNWSTYNGCTINSNSCVLDGNAGYIAILTTPNWLNAWSPSAGLYSTPTAMTFELVFSSTDTGGYLISKPWNGAGNYNYTMMPTSFGLVTQNGSASQSYPNICTGNIVHMTWWVDAVNYGYSINGGTWTSGSVAHGLLGYGANSSTTNDFATLIGSLYPYGQGWAGNTSFSVASTIYLFRMYKRVLTPTEIYQNFCATRKRFGL